MKPWVAPEKRPSVMSATDSDGPSPTIAPVTWSISRMPGPPCAPRTGSRRRRRRDPAGLDGEALLLGVEHARWAAVEGAVVARDFTAQPSGARLP